MRKKEGKMLGIQHSGLTLERGKEGKRKRKERSAQQMETVCYKMYPPTVSRCILWRGTHDKDMGFALNKSLLARLIVWKTRRKIVQVEQYP